MLNSPNKNKEMMFGQELILNPYDCDLKKIRQI